MKRIVDEGYVRLLISMNLKRLRTLHKISQLELAEKADLSANFINDIESGKKGISIETLTKLCLALHAEPFQFFITNEMLDGKVPPYLFDVNNTIQWMLNDLTSQYKQKSDG